MCPIIKPDGRRLGLAHILRNHIDDYQTQYQPLWPQQRKIIYQLLNCRTAYLGGHIDRCDHCGTMRIAYHSCRNRHCPTISGHGTPRTMPLSQVARDHSKNGAYAIATIDCLKANPALEMKDLWRQVKRKYELDTGDVPAASNQGGPTLTYKLWHLDLLR